MKTNIEAAKEAVITYGRMLSLWLIEPPIIIGSNMKAQGAKTVKIPAKNDKKINDIRYSSEAFSFKG
ncbi:MAG: hypothetical protein OHK0017_02510 [Patescibacteria group bacterium]